jgi:hypothetical protein
MIIKNVEGRWQTVRTDSESIEGLFGAIDKMSVEERKLLRMVFSQLCKNETTVIKTLQNLEYEEPPASPEKFLTDPYYFGEVGKGLYTWVKDDIARLFNQGFEEVVLTGAQRTGKDTFAHIAVSYLLHLLLCLKDPATSYGLAKGSMLHTVLLSATQEMAKEIVFGGLIEKIKQSPWFSKFGKSMKVLSEEIRFPKGLVVKGAESTDLGVIGLSTCVTGDTLIKLPDREESIDSLLKTNKNSEFEIINCSSSGLLCDSAHIIDNGIKDVYEIALEDGKKLNVTGNHRILVRKSHTYFNYVKVEDLKACDDVVTDEEFKTLKLYPFVCSVCSTEGFSTIRKRSKAEVCSKACFKNFMKFRMTLSNPFKGRKHSEETKRILSKKKRGVKLGPCPAKSEALRNRWALYRAAHPRPINEKRERKPWTQERLAALRERIKKFWTPEQREAASKRMKRFRHTDEGKRKIAESNSRRGCSDATRKKMSLSISNLHKNKRENYQYVGFLNTRFGNIGYRSVYEKIALEVLESNDQILFVETEPFLIPYTFNGREKHCLPDFFITYKDGTKKLLEVKSTYYIRMPISQAKISAMKTYCQTNNIPFELWDEETLCRLSGKTESKFYE